MRVHVFDDEAGLSQHLCNALVQMLGGPHVVPTGIMIAGGSTPLAAFRLLAAERRHVDPFVRIIFSDDRHVPPDHDKSNYLHIAPLLHQAGVADAQILRIRGELPLAESVKDYQEKLESFFSAGGTLPFGFLGLGADGHTASLFNAGDIARGVDTMVVGVQRPDGLEGVSLTPTVLARVERLAFVVAGAGKKAMVHNLLNAPETIAAGLATRGHRGVELWTDRTAMD